MGFSESPGHYFSIQGAPFQRCTTHFEGSTQGHAVTAESASTDAGDVWHQCKGLSLCEFKFLCVKGVSIIMQCVQL